LEAKLIDFQRYYNAERTHAMHDLGIRQGQLSGSYFLSGTTRLDEKSPNRRVAAFPCLMSAIIGS
jgi:hypothetical protein